MIRQGGMVRWMLAVMIGTAWAGCSTRKNTAGTRAFHELTTRYNVFFNAQQAYDDALEARYEAFQEDYSELLPLYPVKIDSIPSKGDGAFDVVIEKTAKAIREHSISVKPRRDRSRPYTQAYREWLRQDEFNPFIKNAWLLMGKAYVQNREYEKGLAVFSQMLRLFDEDIDLLSEVQIEMLRAYAETGWNYDADNMAYLLRQRKLAGRLDDLFAETYAYYLLRKKDYLSALPYLRRVIEKDKNSRQKMRLRYLLGQTYAALGSDAEAYDAFESVKGLGTPYELAIHALIRQSALDLPAHQKTIIQRLERMAGSAKNEPYRDGIHYAVGAGYLLRNDTAQAIEHLHLAGASDPQNSLYAALAMVKLGDIYFARKDYVKAGPVFTAAVALLPESHPEYIRVRDRAEVLGALVPHMIAVQEQDSLQEMVSLPRTVQLERIDRRIVEWKKTQTDAEREAYLAGMSLRGTEQNPSSLSPAEAAAALAAKADGGTFYFDAPALVAQGKSEFRRRWGNRALEDNWRLSATPGSLPVGDAAFPDTDVADIPPAGEGAAVASAALRAADPSQRDYYLQQLPSTPEALAASNRIIEENLFPMGAILKDRLQDYDYAARTFRRYLNDFPGSPRRPDVYYQLYLLYLRLGDTATAETYRRHLLAEYPGDGRSTFLSSPDYRRVLENYAGVQDSLYQEAYQAYRRGEAQKVQSLYTYFESLFGHSSLMPQFMLLEGLSYVQTGDAEKAAGALKKLREAYPESPAASIAEPVIAGLAEGRDIVTGASAIVDFRRGREKTVPGTASESFVAADTVSFSVGRDAPHAYLLVMQESSVRKNELLFAAADFNFSRFQLRAFDLSFIRVAGGEALRISPFRSLSEAQRYAQMAASDSAFHAVEARGILPLVISEENLRRLSQEKTLASYIVFYTDSLSSGAEDILLAEPLAIPAVADSLQTDEAEEPPSIIQKEAEIVPQETEKIVPLEPEKIAPEVIRPQPLPQEKAVPLNAAQREGELQRKAEEALQRQRQETEQQKDRKTLLKERERERKEKIRQREQERQEKLRRREEDLKRRQQEREQRLRER